MTKTTMLRVPTNLMDEYRSNHPELEGLTYTAVVEVMLRELLKAEHMKKETK